MVKKKLFPIKFISVMFFSTILFGQGVIVDHNCTSIKDIPESAIIQAKDNLHIAYGHTSHGSQLTKGMTNLVAFINGGGLGLALPENIFAYNNGGTDGALDLHDNAMGGDCGYYPQWVDNTRGYLDNSNHSDVNVIIWSWCGQAGGKTEQGMIDTYLAPMTQLESDYPNVKFVYMTGHADGHGESGNLHLRNQQIRDYCVANNKVLYDFYNIECYDPDGNYYGDKHINDNCDYDTDGDGSLDGNWAKEWQNSHTVGIDWYDCSAAHSQPLNGNRKAYAAWWLWAKLAGWEGVTSIDVPANKLTENFQLNQNYPNPFNPTTTIKYTIPVETLHAKSLRSISVLLKVYDILGKEIAILVNEKQNAGTYNVSFNASSLNSGIYFYRITTDNFVETKQMILMK